MLTELAFGLVDFAFHSDYWWGRFLFQRGLGIIYFLAFLTALKQFRPLAGEDGLLPIRPFLAKASFSQAPSIFHWYYSDRFFGWVARIGAACALLTVTGISELGPLWLSMGIWAMLYILYLSIVNVGQTFYGFGWESILLEAGFLAIFLGPMHMAVPGLVIFLLRWLLFRIEFGAGLIKIRGDECWRKLTCMNYHHETQPLPNPLSWYFHHLPEGIHKIETFINHSVQLVLIWGIFFPQPVASISATLIILSQLYLVLSGNYAWLNWMTILLALTGYSDGMFQVLFGLGIPQTSFLPLGMKGIVILLFCMFLVMSYHPVKNMLSSTQKMNLSFNPWHLAGTYGAFGSVTHRRMELVIEGTRDQVPTADTEWQAYEFRGKPGDPDLRPPQIAPYHLRLDWQIWFAAMTSYHYHPWFLPFIKKLLRNDKAVLELLDSTPFPEQGPTYIRVLWSVYEFTSPEEREHSGTWWKRRYVREYLSPVREEDL